MHRKRKIRTVKRLRIKKIEQENKSIRGTGRSRKKLVVLKANEKMQR